MNVKEKQATRSDICFSCVINKQKLIKACFAAALCSAHESSKQSFFS